MMVWPWATRAARRTAAPARTSSARTRVPCSGVGPETMGLGEVGVPVEVDLDVVGEPGSERRRGGPDDEVLHRSRDLGGAAGWPPRRDQTSVHRVCHGEELVSPLGPGCDEWHGVGVRDQGVTVGPGPDEKALAPSLIEPAGVDRGHQPVGNRVQDLVLRRVMTVDRGGLHAEFVRESTHRERGEPVLVDEDEGGIADPLPAQQAHAGSGHGAPWGVQNRT